MSPLAFLIWMLNIAFDTAGQLSFKAAATRNAGLSGLKHWQDMLKRPWIWVGIGCYVAEFICWVAFLSLVPLSVGVMLASINIVAIMVAGKFLFGEKITSWRFAGMVLVSLGVIVVGIEG